MSIKEAEVELARGKPARQGPRTGWGGVASRAVDGNTNTRYNGNSCTHTHKDAGSWWKVDLQTEAVISKVKVWNRSDCCSNRLRGFEVRVGNAGTWQHAAKCGNKHTIGGSGYIDCTGKAGRNVFVVQTRADVLTLCEVKVYGFKAAGMHVICCNLMCW